MAQVAVQVMDIGSSADTADTAGSADHPHARLVRTEGRDLAVTAFEVAVVSFFVDAADMLGVPKSVAAIYGLCFASPEQLSLTDINERLNISVGSISQGLRVLREVGALRVADRPALNLTPETLNLRGPRLREYYVPDLELRKLASRFIEQRLEKQLKSGRSRLQTMKAAIPPGDSATTKELKARLKYLQGWHNKSKALVPVVKAFLKLT